MNRDPGRTFLSVGRWPLAMPPRGFAEAALRAPGSAASRDVVADFMGELWVILMLIVFVVGIIVGQPWIVALAVMSTLVGLVARFWARLSLEEFSYTRTVSQDHMFPGEEFELTITIENRKPLPVPWVRVREEIPNELEMLDATVSRGERFDTSPLEDTLSLAWYERVRRRYRLKAKRRGFLMFGPARVQSGDLFGLFRSTRMFTHRDAVVVYPHIVPLDDLPFPSARPVGDANSRVRMFEDLNRPSGLREYRAGDPMRRIDWKATARLRVPQVRTYDYSVEHYLVILVDVLTAEKAWEGYSSRLLERVVTAAASFASRAAELGYRVGMVSNGIPLAETGRMVIRPSADPRQLPAILEALAMVRPLAIGRLDSVIAAEPQAIPFGASIVAISSVIPERLLYVLDRLATRGHPVDVIYVGAGEPPSTGARFEIQNLGERFDVGEMLEEEPVVEH